MTAPSLTTWPKCGHPRTPQNTSTSNGKRFRQSCLTCNRERTRERVRGHRGGSRGNWNKQKTECRNGHPYNEENTYVYNGARQCKACRKLRTKEWFERNPEFVQARNRKYFAENKERMLEDNRRWFKENRERANLNGRIKANRKRAAGKLSKAEWLEVLGMYGERCLACGTDSDIQIDHVIPISRGGSNTKSNVQPLCGTCNQKKAIQTIDYRPAVTILERS